jgi:excisionase family DNA binding protein
MKAWLTVAEAAQFAGVSRDTIYTACERREIRQVRVGGRRAIRLRPEWIDAWLERHALDALDRHTAGRTPSSVDVRSEATS